MTEKKKPETEIAVVQVDGENLICERTDNFFTMTDLQAKIVAVDKQIEQAENQLSTLRDHRIAVANAVAELKAAEKPKLKIVKDKGESNG